VIAVVVDVVGRIASPKRKKPECRSKLPSRSKSRRRSRISLRNSSR
jgi:hypothetical protein